MVGIHGAGVIQNASANALSKKSAPQISELMMSYKDPDHQSLVAKNKEILAQTKDVLGNNINEAINRSNAIEGMDVTAQELNQASSTFRDKSREARNTAYWQMIKMYVGGTLLVLTVLGILIIVIMASTGGFESDDDA